MINFTDIIKGKFLEEFSAISMGNAVVAIGLSFLLSSLLSCPFEWATLPVNLFLALVSFFVQRAWVFKK